MFGDWVKLTRLPNALTAGLGVFLGYFCLPGNVDYKSASLGASAMAVLAAAGNMQNDLLDLNVDRINRPDRMLPSGRISPQSAKIATAVLFNLAALFAFALGRSEGFLTLIMGGILCLYNMKLKSLPLWGNLAVALLCSLTIYLPELGKFPDYTAFPCLFAFLTTLAREVAKDAEDVVGDGVNGYSTLPIRFGEGAAKGVVAVACMLVLLMLPLPWLRFGYHVSYLGVVGLFALPLLATVLVAMKMANPAWGAVQRRLKWIMLVGIAAILAGVYGN